MTRKEKNAHVLTAEERRLEESLDRKTHWKRWGPYVSERAWGTVREDYSAGGTAWDYFPHDHARSRAYRWNEDGLAGICDRHQMMCFALALWNGRDPILKERIFGLTGSEGNHGEDVKEYYFYLDSTPTHSYMKYLYKYPQAEFPYARLVEENRSRDKHSAEFELLDTGAFNDNRNFDVFVEYAKVDAEDILIKITASNRGPEAARIHLLPTVWFRNRWSWGDNDDAKPVARNASSENGPARIELEHFMLGHRWLYCEGAPELLFTENETNTQRLFNSANTSPYVKDAFHNYVIHGKQDAVNPEQTGTKAAAHYAPIVGPGGSATIRLRLTNQEIKGNPKMFGKEFELVFAARQQEADEFYATVIPQDLSADARNVMRQAFAGMLWSKQFYHYVVKQWLEGDPKTSAPPQERLKGRNHQWPNLYNADVISMPDKWEYPWYAAWDLAFHCIPLALIDPEFAKEQLVLMTREWYMHPNGQLPAYEWALGDVNPPVHAWAAWRVYKIDKKRNGKGDRTFLERVFHKLMLNFTWWVKRKDAEGSNIFEGGFLGLDNIGVVDRSAPLPTGGHLEQADGTAWMALFSQNMLELALELTLHDRTYEDMVVKFAEHFLYIAAAMNRPGQDGMWDEEDGFYYDLLRLPDGSATRLKVRSMVGLLPLCATTVFEKSARESVPRAMAQMGVRLRRMPELLKSIHPMGPGHLGVGDRGILALVNPERLRRILTKMLDENEFLSPYGIRSLSKFHEQHAYVFHVHGQEYRVDYLPGESNTGMFGGNSNWRGPIWMPVNLLIIRALQNFYLYYGDNFKIECPTGSGKMMNLFEVSKEIADRLTRIFSRDPSTRSAGSGQAGRRPVYGGTEKFQTDPHWRDHILFYEYFHGDNGAGLGASHQTGWTGIVAKLIQLYGVLDPTRALAVGKQAGFVKGAHGAGETESAA